MISSSGGGGGGGESVPPFTDKVFVMTDFSKRIKVLFFMAIMGFVRKRIEHPQENVKKKEVTARYPFKSWADNQNQYPKWIP